ncbi:MAG TPA: carbohydrate porin [Terriglobales bacterium]|nr:carbohydrate porin [Terriglobales bacterium]
MARRQARLAALFVAIELAISTALLSALPRCVLAQETHESTAGADTSEPAEPAENPSVTLFPHPKSERYWISAQDNIIFQYHPSFPAKYSGVNSLHPHGEHATSNIGTLYLGYALLKNTELYFNIESADGGGLSDALGLAGFTNVDVVRNPQLGVSPYIARGLLRQIVPLSKETVEAQRGPLSLDSRLPVRRFEFYLGKFSMPDFFDVNAGSGDSHSQFLNWTIINNGAYDYAADTRGYTVGVVAEYYDRSWAFRFSEALMPTVANGIQYRWNLSRARAENYELEFNPEIWRQQSTVLKLLGYENHGNMGLYQQAINDFLAGKTTRPDITAHPLQNTVKYGLGVNLQQSITPNITAFARWGWNEGQHESFAYTEVEQTWQAGADLAGQLWHRRLDKWGAAFVSNGISAVHARYLALGGRGFLLGDGTLNCGRENIFESYYTAHLWRGIFAGPDLQHINNPGYNRDRGPVWVAGARFHLDF